MKSKTYERKILNHKLGTLCEFASMSQSFVVLLRHMSIRLKNVEKLVNHSMTEKEGNKRRFAT